MFQSVSQLLMSVSSSWSPHSIFWGFHPPDHFWVYSLTYYLIVFASTITVSIPTVATLPSFTVHCHYKSHHKFSLRFILVMSLYIPQNKKRIIEDPNLTHFSSLPSECPSYGDTIYTVPIQEGVAFCRLVSICFMNKIQFTLFSLISVPTNSDCYDFAMWSIDFSCNLYKLKQLKHLIFTHTWIIFLGRSLEFFSVLRFSCRLYSGKIRNTQKSCWWVNHAATIQSVTHNFKINICWIKWKWENIESSLLLTVHRNLYLRYQLPLISILIHKILFF